MHWLAAAALLVILACGQLLSRQAVMRKHPQWRRPLSIVGLTALVFGLAVLLGEQIVAGNLPALLFALAGGLLWLIACCAVLLGWQHLQRWWRLPHLPKGVKRADVLASAPYDYAAWQGEGYRIWHVDAPDDFLAGGMESLEEVEDWILIEMVRTGQVKRPSLK